MLAEPIVVINSQLNQNIMLYTLILYSNVQQLFLNKTGKKNSILSSCKDLKKKKEEKAMTNGNRRVVKGRNADTILEET